MRNATIVVALGLALAGCAHSGRDGGSAAPRRTAADYYPLGIGNRWVYEINGRSDRTVTVEILRQDSDGFFVDSQGGQLRADAFGIRDPKRYLLRDPLEQGRTWTNIVSVSSAERYAISSVGTPCEAPAGKFEDCVQVEAKNRVDANVTLVNRQTYAPGVGLVRVQVLARHSNGKEVPQTWLDLRSFELGEAK